MGVKQLFVDLVMDAIHVWVRRERCPTVLHLCTFDGEKPSPISICGVKERGGWRVVPDAYTELPRCARCERLHAKQTHDAPPPTPRGGTH